MLQFSSLIIVLAYLFYLGLFYILKRLFRENLFAISIINYLRLPILFLILEIGLVISINILIMPDDWRKVLEHLMVILFIVTIGWSLINLATACENFLKQKKEKEVMDEDQKQSFITRAEIFYRSFILLIILLTLASIIMTFPSIRSFGIGILGSAGVAGIALGIAARPILLNLMAGFQIAFSKMLKIGDIVVIEGQSGSVENIYLTHIILKTSDLRRIIIPISNFIDKPFENWSRVSNDLIATVFLYCDYTAPLSLLREKFKALLETTPLWNRKSFGVDVTDMTAEALEIRFTMSANNPPEAFNLRCYIREKLLEFLQKEHPDAFAKTRYVQ
jgi:small-conductance mechanosensitive channel